VTAASWVLLRVSLLLAVDDLGDAEVFEAFETEFEAVAGLFGSAEGDAGVHGAVFVDPGRRVC
jgi:hypothetical protein